MTEYNISKFKFQKGDLIATNKYHSCPGHIGVLLERDQLYPGGASIRRIQWFTNYPLSPMLAAESEMNLYDLRDRYRFFNSEHGEYYYASKDR